MTPHVITEVPLSEVHVPPVTTRTPRPVSPQPPAVADYSRASEGSFLRDALLENHRVKSSSKTLDLLLALTFHVVVFGVPILAGLYYTATLSPKEFASMMLVAPPPPPPAPPAPAAAMVKQQAPKRVFMNDGKLLAPTVVPKEIAMIKEAPLDPDVFAGVGGVPGGVPGGQMGGVIGGVLGGIPGAVKPLAAPTVHSKAPVRVGGRVRRPQLLKQVAPRYPILARDAHISGDVVIDAVLDEHGNVTEMKILSGAPLFYAAAMAALSEWKYEPTYLNDEPVSVQLIVTITFRLNN